MPILENATDYAEDGQVTHTNLNALTESAKFVKTGVGVTNSGNTTDEATLDINASGELIVATADGTKGINTAQINDEQITNAKLSPTSGTASVSGSGGSLTNVIEAASIGNADMAANSIDSDQYVDGSIDHVHLANDAVTGATDHADSGAGSIPQDADELLLYDDSAADLVKASLDVLARHAAFAKAYGVVDFSSSGTPTQVAGAYGCSFNAGALDVVTIDLTNDMSSTNYVVQTTIYHNVTSFTAEPAVEIVSASQFKIHYSGDVDVSFTVHGALANL